ncbi:MAG: ABC-type glycerol-3-phosphate transport system substrate-binding protein [Myxococcota bacterium]|jgi:ABC-type glycerol-3-phosphate transport system substrate-binding protein
MATEQALYSRGMSPRFWLILALILALILPLAGCSNHQPRAPERDRVRILIPASYKAQIQALLASGVRDFSFDADDIDWVDLPWYSGRDAVFAQSLAARFAGSDPDADAFFIDLYRTGSFRPAWLTRFEGISDQFRPVFLHAAMPGADEAYAVPWSAKGNFLFYRKDLVPKPPKTFEEMEQACRAIPVRTLPATIRYCLLVNWDSIENDLYPALWSLRDSAVQKQDGRVDLSSDESVAFLTRVAAMLGDTIRSGFTVMPPAAQIASVGKHIHRRFARGEAVFMITWNNRYRYMLSDVGDALPPTGMAPVPAARDGAQTSSNIGSWGWIVPRVAEGASEKARARHAAALRFVQEVSSPEAVRYFVEKEGMIPARNDVPLPKELEGVLSPEILAALGGAAKGFVFRDRGSDAFVHGYVRDAIRDVLTCATAARKPLPTGLLGDCARYLEQCTESESAATNCLMVAVRRRLQAAQQSIDGGR